MTGGKILKAISQEEPFNAIPIILMTTSVNIGDARKYPNLLQHLMKPASIDVLLEALQAVFSR